MRGSWAMISAARSRRDCRGEVEWEKRRKGRWVWRDVDQVLWRVGLREVFHRRRGSCKSEMLEVRWALPAWGWVLPWWIGYMQSSKWTKVRLSEKREENGENPLARRGKWRHCSSECGWTLDRRRCVRWSSVSLLLVSGVELKSLASQIVWSEEFWKCFEGKITPAIVFQVYGVHFIVNGNDFPFDQIFHVQSNTR